MRWILMLFPLVMLARQAFGVDVDFGSRLSAKNILLYMALLIIVMRMANERRLRIDLPAIQYWFVLLICYAVLSWAVASFVIRYPNYPVVENGILLKLLLVDHFLIYLAFFYGPRTIAETLWVLKALLLVAFGVQFVTVGEGLGLLATDFVDELQSGRPEGLIGESNQSASFAILFVPGLLAMAIASRGVVRLVWTMAVLLSVVGFLIMASRGATVGALVAVVAGTYLLRHQLSAHIVIRWSVIAAVIFSVGLSLASIQYSDLLYQRFIVDTFGGTVDDASMGRTMIWAQAVAKMWEEPVSLLTGLGWRVYWSLPNVLSPHNTYLNLWFNLGVPGVLSYVAIFGAGLFAAVRSSERASPHSKGSITAFAFAIISAAVALFFLEWYQPWPYFWAYFGLCMRLVVLGAGEASAETDVAQRSGEEDRGEGQRIGRVEFGWSSRRD